MRRLSVDSVFSLDSLAVGTGKNWPQYALGQFQSVEIDDQSQWNIKQFHVAEQLSFVDRKNLLDRFYFDKQALVA